jgi:hypothetical protein
VIEDVEQGLTRLFDLLTFHAARCIEDKDDVLGDDLCFLRQPRRGKEKEVALVRLLVVVADDAGIDGLR